MTCRVRCHQILHSVYETSFRKAVPKLPTTCDAASPFQAPLCQNKSTGNGQAAAVLHFWQDVIRRSKLFQL